jgi:hypothetical protein
MNARFHETYLDLMKRKRWGAPTMPPTRPINLSLTRR